MYDLELRLLEKNSAIYDYDPKYSWYSHENHKNDAQKNNAVGIVSFVSQDLTGFASIRGGGGADDKETASATFTVKTSLQNKSNNLITNWFNIIDTTDYGRAAATISDPTERNEHVLTPGTKEYIREILGIDTYNKLSEKDREFFAKASVMFDLGESVDMKSILRYLDEEL